MRAPPGVRSNATYGLATAAKVLKPDFGRRAQASGKRRCEDRRMAGYDALLVVSFGGPEGPDDVLPFLRNVTRGRHIPDERLRAVGEHYLHFGGVSPINAQNRALVTEVRAELDRHALHVPVYWGNRNWVPLLSDTVRAMYDDGVRRVLAFFTSAYASYAGCRQYRENLAEAVAALGADAASEMTVDRIGPYHDHAGFLEPFVDAAVRAWSTLPPQHQQDARLVFTTHSLPVQLGYDSGTRPNTYVAQHQAASDYVARRVGEVTGWTPRWNVVFQSRSGPPEQPWLEPDIEDHLVALAREGVTATVVVPIGFVSDHMEVLWDLDTAAAALAARLGLSFVRAATPGTDQRFVAMIRQLVQERLDDVPVGQRVRVCGRSAAPDRCPAGCCANPRGPRPALGGQD